MYPAGGGGGQVPMVAAPTAEDERLQQQQLEADDATDFDSTLNDGGHTLARAPSKPTHTQQHNHTNTHRHPPPSVNGHAANTGAHAVVKIEGQPHPHGHAQPQQHGHHAPPPPPPSSSHPQQPRFHASQMPSKASSGHGGHHPPQLHVSGSKSSAAASAAASPSASSSPHSAHAFTIPFQHATPLFGSNAVYLKPSASPSQLDGLTAKDEFMLRSHTCMFMSAMGQRLKLGQLALATASQFLQVFFTHYSFKAFDRLEIACTCLFLAGKVEERRIRVDLVLGAYYQDKELEEKKWATAQAEDFAPRPKPILDSPEWDALRNRVYEYEAILLDAIEYNFDVLHPYSYLRKFLEKYIYSSLYCKENEKFVSRHLSGAGGLAQIAWNFINDSLRTPLCLQYAPSVICVAAIRLAMRHLITVTKQLDEEPTRKLMPGQQPPSGKQKMWHEELFGVDKNTMKYISGEIMRVLELQKDPKLDLLISEAHRKSKQRSTVPLPCARSTQELMASISRQQQGQGQRQPQQQLSYGQQQMQRGPPLLPVSAAAAASSAASAPASATSSHPDRKRARSPTAKAEGRARSPTVKMEGGSGGGGRRRDVVDLVSTRPQHRTPPRQQQQPQPPYSPLDRPPSPFLNADVKMSWLPDLRRDREVRESPHKQQQQQQKPKQQQQQQQRDGRDGDKDRHARPRDREQQPPQSRDQKGGPPQPGAAAPRHDRQGSDAAAASSSSSSSKSPHARPRSHDRRDSHRRSNSRDRVHSHARANDTAGSTTVVASSAVSVPTSSPLEEGELREEKPQLSTIREEGSSEPPKLDTAMEAATESRLLLSPRAMLAAASSSLTKSCSTLTLSSLSVSSTTSTSRLHVSSSMSNLHSASSTGGGLDILAGDILRMSSSHSPSDPTLAASLAEVSVANEDDIMRDIHRGAKELGRDEAEAEAEATGADNEEEEGRQTKRARIGGSRPASPFAVSSRTANGEFEEPHSSHSHAAMETSAVAASAAPTATVTLTSSNGGTHSFGSPNRAPVVPAAAATEVAAAAPAIEAAAVIPQAIAAEVAGAEVPVPEVPVASTVTPVAAPLAAPIDLDVSMTDSAVAENGVEEMKSLDDSRAVAVEMKRGAEEGEVLPPSLSDVVPPAQPLEHDAPPLVLVKSPQLLPLSSTEIPPSDSLLTPPLLTKHPEASLTDAAVPVQHDQHTTVIMEIAQ